MDSLIPSAALLGAALLVLPVLPRQGLARVAVMGISAVAMLRYLVWRLTETLPPLSADPAVLWMWSVGVLEALALLQAIVTAVFLMRRGDRRAEADAREAKLRQRRDWPAVDVVIPTYNEPLEVLERGIVGALALDWPGEVRVWVLDDRRRSWLRDYCAAKGARWVTRSDNSGGKAGNINAWLAGSEAQQPAPLVMVLDADFVPQRHFLWRVAGFFDDDAVALVQTPQSFFNADPIQMNLLCGGALADEQRFFYHEFQPSLDAWGAAFCCGTSFVARRDRLQVIGGIPTDTVTEDMMTTYALAARGWRTVYLNEPLSAGLAAEGLSEFVTQRARWCLGTVQALRSPDSPLRAPNIAPMSRLCFLNAQLFWLVSCPLMLVASCGPAVYWWSGVPAFLARPEEFLSYFGPRFVAEAAAMFWISRGAVVPLLGGLSSLVTAPTVVAAAASALLRPKGHRFAVTAKGGDRGRMVVHGRKVAWIAALMAVIASGMLVNYLPSLSMLAAGGPSAINLGWSLYALTILFLALLVCVEVPRRRRDERMPSGEMAQLRGAHGLSRVRVADLSMTGAMLDWSLAPPDGPVELILTETGGIPAEVVRGSGSALCLRFAVLEGACRDALLRKLYTLPNVLPPSGGLSLGRAFRAALRRSFASDY